MLETLDLKKKLSKIVYQRQMKHLQERLRLLQYEGQKAELPIIVCLEGWDCAGKGRVIKKLLERLDPRLFRVYYGSAPTPLELRHHFLWRYQIKLPNDGEMAVLDHSWYGRVLVERCDKLVKKKIWRGAYEQINQFERWLVDDGQVLIKIWMHISKKEQKNRFRAMLKDRLMAWKVSKEYWRHHKQYERWVEAVEEMVARTNTPLAPWTLVEAEDQRWARVKVFETLVNRIESVLAQRKKAPEAVSRTAAAKAATQAERESRKASDTALAREEEKMTPKAEKARPKPKPRVNREVANAQPA